MGLVEFYPNGSKPASTQLNTVAAPTVKVDQLANHIRTCWNDAKMAKQPVEQIMLDCLLARDNRYSEEKLAMLDPTKTSRVYIPIASTKCRDAKAWILDIIKPDNAAWTLDPTPIPDLPPEVLQAIQQDLIDEHSDMLQSEVNQYGAVTEPTRTALWEMAEERKKIELEEIREEAKKKAEAHKLLIQDQLVEGGFIQAFDDFVDDLVTLKSAIIKGPVIRSKKRAKWTANGLVYEQKLVKEVDRVDPFNFYPGRDCESVNDTYTLERHRLSRTDLNDLLGVPGYSDARIRAVLSQYTDGGGEWLAVDNKVLVEQAKKGYRQNGYGRSERIDALEFWGSVPGKYLIEWGLVAEDDGTLIEEELQYEINAWLIDQHVIKAIINPDKLRRKPYSVTSYIKIPGSIWGRCIPELVEGSQEAGNAIARGIVNNSAFAALPQTDVNMDKLAQTDDPNNVHPGKVWKSTGNQMNERAVVFYQPQLIANALVNVLEFWLRRADADSGVPAYAHGDVNVGGAGNTSSGLSMLISMASRGIMNVVRNIDVDIFSTLITRFHDLNLLYHPDDSIKGDARVVAKGASGLMQKEQTTMRLKEFARDTNNPGDLSITGKRGRTFLLREVAKSMELDADKIFPDEQKTMQMDQSGAQAGVPMIAGAGSITAQDSEGMDVAGKPLAGQDTRLFNQEAQP